MSLSDLASAVRTARGHRTLEQIAAAGGPSANTVSAISRFDPRVDEPWPVRDTTLAALDDGCGWEPGKAQRLYELEAERPGVVVTNADELAEVIAERVCALLAERLRPVS